MTIITTILPVKKARFIQNHCAEYGCDLIKIAISEDDSAKVTISGDDRNVKKLFDQIGKL